MKVSADRSGDGGVGGSVEWRERKEPTWIMSWEERKSKDRALQHSVLDSHSYSLSPGSL